MRRLSLLTLVLAATLVIGCGSSSSSSKSSSAPAQTAPTATTSSSATAGSTTSTGTGSTNSAIGRLILRTCKNRIQAVPALTSGEKATIEKLCSKETAGGSSALEANQQICREIVNRSALQGSAATSAREQALAACKKTK
ncbi:MAG: hypothetical protein QOF54_1726 [Solirubrobacteraceae bacterium]|nr:hypothetical protein [Solirubrobacteraceae bacterium]